MDAHREIVCLYAGEDGRSERDLPYYQELEKHLSSPQRQGRLTLWHLGKVEAGQEPAEELEHHLESAALILLLLSVDFFHDDDCHRAMLKAFEQYKQRRTNVWVIPVRPVEWQDTPCRSLRALPHAQGFISKLERPAQEDAWRQIASMITDARGVPSPLYDDRPSAFPSIWNVPYPSNPFFTGREDQLRELRSGFDTQGSSGQSLPYALTGLGGIGKTQIALAYVYRHSDRYRAVCWVRAGSEATLVKDLGDLVEQLELPAQRETNQARRVRAVRRWFDEHDDWLLVMDNADDVEMVFRYLPVRRRGHILLTTRNQHVRTRARVLDIPSLTGNDGSLLLLRRADLLSRDLPLEQADPVARRAADDIVQEMGGLPLALEQAGAYIVQTPYDLPAYLTLFQQQQMKLLRFPGPFSGSGGIDASQVTVATTWTMAFQQIRRESKLAAELLRCCAFLAPDAIPEEIFRAGASELGRTLQQLATQPHLLNDAIRTLRRYSLLTRTIAEDSVSVHRLVQVVLRGQMRPCLRRRWAKRVVRSVYRVFPDDTQSPSTWGRCQRLLPHALICTRWIEEYHLWFQTAADLLIQVGYYQFGQNFYAQAELLYQQALATIAHAERQLRRMPLSRATGLGCQGLLYQALGKYDLAEELLLQSLKIRKQALGSEHPDTAMILSILAVLYHVQKRYGEAQPLYQRALSICENEFGATHPLTNSIREHYALLQQQLTQEGK